MVLSPSGPVRRQAAPAAANRLRVNGRLRGGTGRRMLFVALAIVAAAVWLMVRRVEVRLVLLGAGLLLATLGGRPLAVLDEFTRAMVAAMVAPICAAMGFAAVLGATGCDRHLVHLLLLPVRRFRWLVLPGGIAAAYLVNMAVPSQTST